MNSPHLSDAELAALPGLPPAERLRAGDHLAACADCRSRRLAGSPADIAQRRRPPPAAAAVFRDLAAAAREEPAGVLAAADLYRLAELPRGRAEAEDLRTFQQRLDGHPAESFGRGETLPPDAEADVADVHAPPSRARGRWFLRLAVPLAATALLLLALAPLATRNSPTGDRPDLVLVDGPLRVGSDRNAAVGLEALPPDLQDPVRQAITHGRLPGRAPTGVLLRGDPDAPAVPAFPPPEPAAGAPRLLAPASGATVAAERPTLRWMPPTLPNLGRQEILLTTRLGGVAETRSGPLSPTTPEWTPPAALVRGNIYRWRVLAYAADGREIARAPAGENAGSSFKVLGEPADTRLELLRQHPAAGRSHLTLGVAYAREGLVAEAAAEFRALLAQNPDHPLARDLLRSLEGSGD